jgi:hypothetical protein
MANETYDIVILEGQTTLDIAIQEYGTLDAIWQIIDDNPSILTNINSQPVVGQILKIQKSSSLPNTDIRAYYRTNQIKVV